MLTVQDYQNILALIAKATISGAEAIPVAVLQQKIIAVINAESVPPVEPPKT